jgi:hypothetical protein
MKIRILFMLFGFCMAALICLFCGRLPANKVKQQEILCNRQLAAALMISDLALWTEARYTRHPSQADFFTPFQDFPASVEHFPAGSMVPPPATGRLRKNDLNDL